MPEKSDKAVLPEDQVRLKPFMGVRPGVYLACLYAAVLLVILFFILFYPGITNPGAVLAVKSEPWGAAVNIDGVYKDAAPCEIFVPRGRRRIGLSLPGFASRQIDMDIGGRLFASILFPLRTEIREKLEAEDPAGAFINEAAEYAAWTFTGEPGAAYQIPLSLSEGAYRLGPAAADPEIREAMEGTLLASARFAVTRAGLRDLIRAKTLLDNDGLSPSPLSLLGSAGDMIRFLGENPGAALWLGDLLTGDARSAAAGSEWYAEAAGFGGSSGSAGTARREPPPQESGARLPGLIQAGQLNFRLVPGGVLPGGNFPAGAKVDDFYISETVISAAAWERFLEQRPRWRKENAEALAAEGLVREEYLDIPGLPGAPAEGVSGISWHAAKAFCEWLTAALPPDQGAAFEVRLPTEAEWEYAAGAPVSVDSGNFWEWCEDPFAPLGFLSAPAGAAAGLGSPERSVRGGAWVNFAGSVRNDTRASLPPSFCSPFVSFRPALAQKAGRP